MITNKINGSSNLESLSAILKREVKYDPATEDLTFLRVVFDPATPPPSFFLGSHMTLKDPMKVRDVATEC